MRTRESLVASITVGLIACMAAVADEPLPTAPMAGPVVSAPAAATQEVAAGSATAAQLRAEAEALQSSNKWVEAREKYWAALDAKPAEAVRLAIEERLGKLNLELARKPWPIPEKIVYTVQPGDSVKRIAQKNGCTIELMIENNELANPDKILPGKRLKVFTGKFAVAVNKTRNDLLLTLNGRFFKRYRVGTGKYGKTPAGAFIVGDRVKEPAWYKDDGEVVLYGTKENILGTRWLGLKTTNTAEDVKGYGIHGTWENDSIGKAESSGCIRLRNEDVEELYVLVPGGTAVEIQE